MADKHKLKNPLQKVATRLKEIHEQHGERHRPSGFSFAFAERVDFLNRELWDEVTLGGSVFMQRDLLRVIENHGPENIAPRYVTIFRGEQSVAAVAAQIVSVTGKHLRHEGEVEKKTKPANLLQRALTPAAKIAAAKLDERLLVAGNLLSWSFYVSAKNPGAF